LPGSLGLLGSHEWEIEAMMTTDKDFKSLVRSRARATGQSYTAARRSLRAQSEAVTAETANQDLRASVQLLSDKNHMPSTMRTLVGGVTATELRTAKVTPAAFAVLAEGVSDPNPRVRWWCVQALDHVPSPEAIEVIAEALDDPVPRVRRNAAHALSCADCKPEWDGTLPAGVERKLQLLASEDSNAKVRQEALRALVCTANRRQARVQGLGAPLVDRRPRRRRP
jgi:HEAT repeat protein